MSRHLFVTIIQVIGALCIAAAAWGLYDGWAAVGAFGAALLTISELGSRRQAPP